MAMKIEVKSYNSEVIHSITVNDNCEKVVIDGQEIDINLMAVSKRITDLCHYILENSDKVRENDCETPNWYEEMEADACVILDKTKK